MQTSKGRFCGSNLPPDVSTPSGTMVLKLHTELQSVYVIPYFSAKYTAHKERPGSGMITREWERGKRESERRGKWERERGEWEREIGGKWERGNGRGKERGNGRGKEGEMGEGERGEMGEGNMGKWEGERGGQRYREGRKEYRVAD